MLPRLARNQVYPMLHIILQYEIIHQVYLLEEKILDISITQTFIPLLKLVGLMLEINVDDTITLPVLV